MAFTWTPEQIRWYENASHYEPFHQQLAALLLPMLRPDDTICDWGCGLGKVSLELASRVGWIHLIDREKLVLDALAREVDRRGIRNITIHQGDAGQMQLRCRVGLMIFFGSPYALMERCLARSSRLLIRVIDITGDGRQSVREKLTAIEEQLKRAGYPYGKRQERLDFGQPFTDRRDASAYMACYRPDMTEPQREAFLERGLIQTGDPLYPCYLPKSKNLVILSIRTDRA